MKTKQELLDKYKDNKEIHDVINAHYGSKTSLQRPDRTILNFDKESVNDIVCASKLTYEDYLDIQIQTGSQFRGAFLLCYYYTPLCFKGEIETFTEGRVCFKRVCVDGMYPDGTCFEGKEDHVWMSIDGFDGLAIGDCVSFFAEPYRYIKTNNGKKLDYGLRNAVDIKKIDPYEMPTDEELGRQIMNQIICESCYLNEHCSRLDCILKKSKSRRKRTRQSH